MEEEEEQEQDQVGLREGKVGDFGDLHGPYGVVVLARHYVHTPDTSFRVTLECDLSCGRITSLL